ncbi:FAD-dependent oxidoreductase [Gemmatimonas sp.]|uniref:flavin monoamine oxidase family protein n=1 Tax=Gemmatimonas sp. TaxID=1962908 RepID=UPI00333F8E3C
MPPIVIIGAGLAGLYTARLLHAANMPCVVLEARDRIGGRILSVDAHGAPSTDGFDLGPSWFWPQAQPVLAELVQELGLDAFPQASDGDVLFERMSREGPQRFQGYPQEAHSYRVAGGTAALVHAIAEALPTDCVQLSSKVTQLSLETDGIAVQVECNGDAVTMRASHVVAALPPRLLAHAVTFSPAIDEPARIRWSSTPTWMAPHAKFFALYERAFWRDAGLSGTAQSMVGPMPEIHDATTASGQAALFGFIGVGAAQRAAMGEGALTGACMEQLVRMFGAEAGTPRTTLLKDWAADDCTATTEDRVPGGHPVPDPAPWVTGAWAERLVLGGSETSSSEPGYLAGAVTAAQSAARRVLLSASR